MNKTEYNARFLNRIWGVLQAFVARGRYRAAVKNPTSQDEGYHWSVNVGGKVGIVHVILETFASASYGNKVNILSIPVKFETFDAENTPLSQFGRFNAFTRKLTLHAKPEEAEGLARDFTRMLDTLAEVARAR